MYDRIVYDIYLKRLYPKDDSIHMIRETLNIYDDTVSFFFRTYKFYDIYYVTPSLTELTKINRSLKIKRLKEKICQ